MRETPLLLPPDLREWAPANHLAHLVLDAADSLEVRHVKVNILTVAPSVSRAEFDRLLTAVQSPEIGDGEE